MLPAGKFMMGSPEGERGRKDSEGPQRQVTIPKPFSVGKYEVTVGQYAEFVRETKHKTGNCDFPEDKSWRDPGFDQTNDHPVVCVSWDDASTYVYWLSVKTGHEYRLLSEAEWEYGARAGTTTAYYFGSTISKNQANHSSRGTTVVGSYPLNAFGLYDIHGNIWEWVEDCWHDNYTGAPADGNAWLSGCLKYKGEDIRVLRGGSWINVSPSMLSANRHKNFALVRFNYYGFRIARTLTHDNQRSTESLLEESNPKNQNDLQSQDKQRLVKAYQVGESFHDCATCPEMVVVPPGKFMMGSPKGEGGRYNNEGPQHQVTISKPFAVGKYEVTVGQFAEFVKETKHKIPPNCNSSIFNRPVVCVNWDDASTYTHWLSTKTGHEYRLLTEAEWEYAARAGTTTAYYFGSTISDRQARHISLLRGLGVVGSYPANTFGLHDMHGNAIEWVEDCWHDDYIDAPTDGSAWTDECDPAGRVLRGGSGNDEPKSLRSAFRYEFGSASRSFSIGFRVARTLTP